MITCEQVFIEEKLMAYLLAMRINPNLKGYRYIKEGVKKIIEDPSKKFNVRRRLYRELGQEFQEKEELVDRSMRHAVEVSYKKKGIKEFERVSKIHFYCVKPTTREVLSLLAETMIMECNKRRNTNSW